MKKALQARQDFGVYGKVKINDSEKNDDRYMLPTMWDKRSKGADIRCRLDCKGCYQDTTDKDDTYANTTLLISLKVLLLIGLAKNCSFNFYDINNAFLHAEVYVKPPIEFYPTGGVLCKLRKAMYRLKIAPKAWQVRGCG